MSEMDRQFADWYRENWRRLMAEQSRRWRSEEAFRAGWFAAFEQVLDEGLSQGGVGKIAAK